MNLLLRVVDGATAFVVLGLATLGIDVLGGQEHDDEQDEAEDDYGLSVGAW